MLGEKFNFLCPKYWHRSTEWKGWDAGQKCRRKVGKTIVEKTADSFKKLAVAVNKSLIDYQKPAIGEEKSAIDDKKSAVDMIKSAIEQQKYNEPSKANILKGYDEIEKNQILGTKEIKEILIAHHPQQEQLWQSLETWKLLKRWMVKERESMYS